MKRLHVSASDIEQMLGPRKKDGFGVWPENWKIVDFFMRLNNKWDIFPTPSRLVYLGLNYPSVQIVINNLGVKKKERAELFNGLMIMEDAALPELNRE